MTATVMMHNRQLMLHDRQQGLAMVVLKIATEYLKCSQIYLQ